MCPVCIVAVGAGVGLCRWLRVDDTISGLWIGGLLAALSIWTYLWLKKKNWSFNFSKVVVPLAYYLTVFVSLYFLGILGHPLNRVLGIDKLVFGTIFGTAIFLASVWLNDFLKSKNQGKIYFPYQKVVIPFVFLLIFSFIFYFIIKCY